MAPEEKAQNLSAYMDGELDADARHDVEERIAADPLASAELDELRMIGMVLREDLEERAEAADYSMMQESVLAQLGLDATVERKVVPVEPEPGLLDRIRDFFAQPQLAFAGGLAIMAIAWLMTSQMQPAEPTVPAPQVAKKEPASDGPTLRGPEAEETVARAAPTLMVESLDVRVGKVVVDQSSDPDGPTVLWHLTESDRPPPREDGGTDEDDSQGDPL